MTTQRPTYAVLPQRRASGWVNCPSHLAQRWAVARVTLKGRARVERILHAFPTRAEAEAICARYHSLAKKDAEKRTAQKAGVPRKGGAVIASSLALDQHNQLSKLP